MTRAPLADEGERVAAIGEGAALRVRPIAMTVAVIIAGLLPIMWAAGPDRKSCVVSPRQWWAA
jgi:Cu/Ag efflux pump CusA